MSIPNTPVLRSLFVLALAALTAPGCGWLHARKIEKRTNPKYREGKATVPGPTRVLAIHECPHHRRGVVENRESRRNFAEQFVPELLRAVGSKGAPDGGSESGSVFCREFYEDEDYPPWEGNAAIRDAVQSALSQGERSLLSIFYAMTYVCEEKTSSVRDKNGALVGTVGTGEVVCRENGGVHLMAYLLSQSGEIIWHSGHETSTRADARTAVDELFEGFPREQVQVVN